MNFHPEYRERRDTYRSSSWHNARPAAPRPWQNPRRDEPRSQTGEEEIDRVVFRCRD